MTMTAYEETRMMVTLARTRTALMNVIAGWRPCTECELYKVIMDCEACGKQCAANSHAMLTVEGLQHLVEEIEKSLPFLAGDAANGNAAGESGGAGS